ncbi:uncharacterized protein BJ212DRAFT_1305591 [Suillus subaureus]|uniref:DUF6830 domain-containing protein n=1 Tax=Suillus subaureus TaxID=48587 RepID=A0A9P7DNJ5_9AGAM|nr:uncharacterized protein BJ212DRAFT_1305591 [Suillus subaureus]KAG1799139.1 hypothetical protein BJ212DRAFT_1305591 [Suillus subaureus]
MYMMDDGPGPEHEGTVVEADDREEVVLYFGAAKTWGRGTTFMKQFESNKYAEERASNPYFPFTSKPDWEMAAFLLQSDLSMSDIDEYLKLEFSLLSHPMLADSFDFMPWKIYAEAERAVHIYYGFMTGDCAWELQEGLPDGATLLGVVLSLDKTKAYIPLALLPVVKFIHRVKHMHGVLADRLLHQCIDIVIEPLKQAAHLGVMMSDPVGFSRYCFTPLVAYVADTLEELVIACTTMNASPVTMATHADFGDPDCHPLCKGSFTLANIDKAIASVSPSELVAFFEECKQYHLNSVQWLFWMDWITADPSSFLTPELLHHFHKMFFDHDCVWCINVMCTRYHTFKEGISNLKQTSGRDYRSIQCYIIAVIAGAAPTQFITAIWALLEFRYLVQAPQFSDKTLTELNHCLRLFHKYKQGIINAGAQRGKGGGVKSWVILKLELLQGVVLSIQLHGTLTQWSADLTEHAHIAIIKVPARAGNNHDYDAQAPHPYRTFSTSVAAYNLGYKPTLTKMTVDKAADHFLLPNLCPAISDYLDHIETHNDFPVGGRHRAHPNCPLPFERIQIWCKIWIQSKNFHDANQLEPLQALLAEPPSNNWPYGRYDLVIINSDRVFKWPKSGLEDTYYAYVEHLDVVGLDNSTANGDRIGDVIRVTQIQAPVHLIPWFGDVAESRLTVQTSMNHSTEFFLNKFWNKQLFYALHKFH